MPPNKGNKDRGWHLGDRTPNKKKRDPWDGRDGKFDNDGGTEKLNNSTEENGRLWPDITKKIMEIIAYRIIDVEENHTGRLLDSVGRFNNKSEKNKNKWEKKKTISNFEG